MTMVLSVQLMLHLGTPRKSLISQLVRTELRLGLQPQGLTDLSHHHKTLPASAKLWSSTEV